MSEITAAGATLVAVSPQVGEYLRKTMTKNKLTFDVLSDRGNQVARQFGLVFTLPEDLRSLYRQFNSDLEKYNGDDSWTLPLPAQFVIDQGSVIRFVDADPDYTIRPEPSQTIAVLKGLGK